MGAVKSAFLFLVFLATFFAASRVLSMAVPVPRTEWERHIAYFKSNHEQYDFVCIGSSRVLHNLDPGIIETVLASKDCKPTGFNLGIPGFQGHGIDHVIRTLGDALEGKLIIIEAFNYASKMPLDGGGRFTQIEKKWHSPYQMVSVARTAIDDRLEGRLSPISLSEVGLTNKLMISYSNLRHAVAAAFLAVKDMYPHLRLFMLEQVPIGLGLGVPPQEDTPPEKYESEEDIEKQKGFRPPPEEQRPEVFERADWLEKVERLLKAKSPGRYSGPNDWAFWNQLAFLEAKNARKVFYVVFPHSYLDSSQWVNRFQEVRTAMGEAESGSPILLNYNRPEVYPEFFRYEARFDYTHLGDDAISLFSRQVAEDIAGYIDSPCRE